MEKKLRISLVFNIMIVALVTIATVFVLNRFYFMGEDKLLNCTRI